MKTSSTYHYKLNARHSFKAGGIYSKIGYNLFSDYYEEDEQKMVKTLDRNGNTDLGQGFINWKYRMFNNLTLVTGLHGMYLFLNDNYSLEPRAGMKWQFLPNQSIIAGFDMTLGFLPVINYKIQF